MANTHLNAITKHYRGKFGNQFIFRNREGRSILAPLPNRINTPVTEAQQNVRRTFLLASRYAKQILQDPDMLAAYTAQAGNGQSAYLMAVTDYLRHPWIQQIDVEAYTGQPGEIIRVEAGDDFRVVSVQVRIIDAGGDEVESGDCVLNLQKNLWEYTTTQAITLVPNVEIQARARDIPGHSGDGSFLFE